MKIQVTVTKEVKEELDIEFPFYYKVDHNPDRGESVIYGCIYPDRSIVIREWENDFTKSFELEVDSFGDLERAGYDGYLSEGKYKSTKEEFVAARGRLCEFLTANKLV